MAEVAKIQWQFSPLWVLWDFWVGMCEESEPVVSLWYDSWGGTVTKLASGLLFFLPFPYICGGLFITLHCPILCFLAVAILYSMCVLLYTTLFLTAVILYLYADVAIALYVYSLYSIYIMWLVWTVVCTLSLHPESCV